jgi:hypothetical protein
LRAPVLSCRKRVGSGDLALAGLLVGNRAVAFAMSDRTREHLLGFWSLLDEILNSVLFLIIGLEVIAIAIGVSHLLAGLLAIPVVLGAREISVALPLAVMARLRAFTPGTYPMPARRHLDRARAHPAERRNSGAAAHRDLRRGGVLGRGPGHDRRPRRPPPPAGADQGQCHHVGQNETQQQEVALRYRIVAGNVRRKSSRIRHSDDSGVRRPERM